MADMVDPRKPEQEAESPKAGKNNSDPIVVVDSDSDGEVERQGTVAESPQIESSLSPQKEIANSQAETDGSAHVEEMESENDGDDTAKDVNMESNPSEVVATPDYLDDDDANDLTPPPESPIPPPAYAEELASRASEQPAGAEDEIVVNNARAEESPGPADQEDTEMADSEEKPRRLVVLSSKRKRTGSNENIPDDNTSESAAADDYKPRKQHRGAPKKTHGVGNVKSVKLGYWRDSIAEDKKDAHSVIGFIDVRDRLRTKIETVTRDGRSLVYRYPLPPGPGGSWVTFDKIVFEPHLVNLDHYQVKEYVKVRYEQMQNGHPDFNSEEAMRDAVQQAIARVAANPPPETNALPAIAYGPDIPEHAVTKSEPKKRSKGTAASAPVVEETPLTVDISGRPSRVVIGTWKNSTPPNRKDRHAVQGVLAQNENFRCKIINMTPDGREVGANFPIGAGQIWCQWEDVDFLDHLQGMSRPQVKEYVRVRQRMMDQGELSEDSDKNDQMAVEEALRRHAQGMSKDDSMMDVDSSPALPMRGTRHQQLEQANGYNDMEGIDRPASVPPPQQGGPFRGIRQSNRAPRHSLPDVQLRAANRGPPRDVVDRLERTNSIAQREIARVEASQMRADQRAANRGYITPAMQPFMPPPPQQQLPSSQFSSQGRPYQQRRMVDQQQQHQQQDIPAYSNRPSSRASGVPSRNGTPTSANFPAGAFQPPSQALLPPPPHPNSGPYNTNNGSGGSNNKSMFDDNLHRLNKVWAAQETNRIKYSQAAGETIQGVNDAKVWGGIKYERKSSGPFQGKLVSSGTIINIDGEDYVEYRVLTKPSFF
ncbi:hypothetical protein B0T20DRAFT_454334 [Sordaria brevicollis]|uniref:Uncharacterized protein n=1 Tax=Sordaria brevicollis TaxID=83679 RepID=A0AAE0UB24_SORBR|nr:hypothetical protein B0T20DRAFT_454334 [Sordaria brevicollis]